jgi:prolyl-tRNA editing enzyme YbaK/EbsC (Cys-tRNA(Pro) deacylase)
MVNELGRPGGPLPGDKPMYADGGDGSGLTAPAVTEEVRHPRIERLEQLLNAARADYTIFVHDDTVRSAEQGVERGFGELCVMAPTLILNSERGYIAAVISGETRLSYKKVKKQMHLKNVSLASPETVQAITGATVGAVSLVNEGLPTIVDLRLVSAEAVYGGCGVACHTLRINVKDLIRVTGAQVFDFTMPKPA